MINIKIADSAWLAGGALYAYSDPLIKQSFVLQLGPFTSNPIFKTPPRNSITRDEGSVYQVNLRPDESFSITDTQLGALMENFTAGGAYTFILNLTNLMERGMVTVDQDGTPLTVSQVLHYTVP